MPHESFIKGSIDNEVDVWFLFAFNWILITSFR